LSGSTWVPETDRLFVSRPPRPFLLELLDGRIGHMYSQQGSERMRAHLHELRNEVTDLSFMAPDINQQLSQFAFFGRQTVVVRHLIEIRYESLHQRRV